MADFASLGLSSRLLSNLQELNFLQPTPIQEKTIPLLLGSSTDVLALAHTGTGKTAAFGLPLIELVDESARRTQALVLAPTRELCMQITQDLERFQTNVKRLNIVPVYGGASIRDQILKIKKGAQIIVATPGRLIDLLEKKAINLQEIEYLVLDEADEMLNMGFKEDIDTILSYSSEQRKVWLFSATMPKEIRHIANSYMNDPEEISVGTSNKSNENIDHQYMLVQERDRYQALKRVLDFHPDMYAVVFCRTKMDTQQTAEVLIKDRYNADALHGDLSQAQRDKVMKAFRDKTLQVLIATDVAARGIDVDSLTHVVHLHLPDEMEFYTHRAGRTARAGKKGVSLAIVSPKEKGKIKQIEKMLKLEFKQVNVPTAKQICENRMLDLVQRLSTVKVNEQEIESFLPKIMEALMHLDKEEIIKRFTSLEFNHFLDYYRDKDDISLEHSESRTERSADYRTGTRLFINLGKMDGLDVGKLLGFVCDKSGLTKKDIGHILLKGAYSFIEVEPTVAEQVKANLAGYDYRGRIIRVEVTEENGDREGDRGAGRSGNRHRGSGSSSGSNSYRGGNGGRPDFGGRRERGEYRGRDRR